LRKRGKKNFGHSPHWSGLSKKPILMGPRPALKG
jgi:hypothetical protein